MKAIFVGPMKTGTSWIHAYLEARGDVSIPAQRKETFFFDRYYHRGESWYLSQFPDNGKQGVEVAPSYFTSQEAISRIRSDLGDVRIIITLRDPVQRLVSHFYHRQRYGQVDGDLQAAIARYPEIREHSLYSTCIQRWKHDFGNGIDLLCYESLVDSPHVFVDRINDILGLSGYGAADPEQLFASFVNRRSAPRNRTVARVAKLLSAFLYDVGADGIVRLLKRMGFRRKLFEGGRLEAVPDNVLQQLEKDLQDEIRFHRETCT